MMSMRDTHSRFYSGFVHSRTNLPEHHYPRLRTLADAWLAIDKPGGFTSADLKLARIVVTLAHAKIEQVQLCQSTLDQSQLESESVPIGQVFLWLTSVCACY